MEGGMYYEPDGHGKMRCIKFSDWVKFKWSDESLFWWEDHEILIFPACKRPPEKTTKD
jgi:hypothetical protein